MSTYKRRNPRNLPEFVFETHPATGTLYDLLPCDIHEADESSRLIRSLVARIEDSGVDIDAAQLAEAFRSEPPLGSYAGEVAAPFLVTVFPRRKVWKRRATMGMSAITIERARRILIEAGYHIEMPT